MTDDDLIVVRRGDLTALIADAALSMPYEGGAADVLERMTEGIPQHCIRKHFRTISSRRDSWRVAGCSGCEGGYICIVHKPVESDELSEIARWNIERTAWRDESND